jgi:hypothetical protein
MEIEKTKQEILTSYFYDRHRDIFRKVFPTYNIFQIIKAFTEQNLKNLYAQAGYLYENFYSAQSCFYSTGKQSDGKVPIKKIPFLIERFTQFFYKYFEEDFTLKLNYKEIEYLFLKKLKKFHQKYGIKRIGKEYYITKDFVLEELILLTLLYLQTKKNYRSWQKYFKRRGYSTSSFQVFINRKRKLNIIPKAVFLLLPPFPERTICINGEKIYLKSSIDFLFSLKKPLHLTNYTSAEKIAYLLRIGGTFIYWAILEAFQPLSRYCYVFYLIYPQEYIEFLEWLHKELKELNTESNNTEFSQIFKEIFEEVFPYFYLMSLDQ